MALHWVAWQLDARQQNKASEKVKSWRIGGQTRIPSKIARFWVALVVAVPTLWWLVGTPFAGESLDYCFQAWQRDGNLRSEMSD